MTKTNTSTQQKSVIVITAREQQVLRLLTDGYSNEEVGKILNLSRSTVEAHRARIMLKLNLHTLPALVKYAIQVGLTAVDKMRSLGEDLIAAQQKLLDLPAVA